MHVVSLLPPLARTFWAVLLHISDPDLAVQRRGYHVIVLALGLVVMGVSSMPLVAHDDATPVSLVVIGLTTITFGAAILLARRGAVTAGACLLIMCTTGGILGTALVLEQVTLAPFFFPLSILLAGLTLRPWAVWLTLLVNLIAIALLAMMLSVVVQVPVTVTQVFVYGLALCVFTALIGALGSQGTDRALTQAIAAHAEAEHLAAKYRHLASYDPLTDLANRSLFHDQLQRHLAAAQRSDGHGFAVLVLDLDRFKTINDSLGHLVGDHLLQEVARRVHASVRPHDVVARLGGDEFAIVLSSLTDPSSAIHVADRVHQCFVSPFFVGGHEVATSTSIGIALWNANYTAPEELVRDADSALYRAKALGRARTALFDAVMHEQAMAQLQLEADLRRAVEHKEFSLHYQPIVSLRTGDVIRVEALLRWNHPERGYVPPHEFIPLAEETGLMVPIGAWTVWEACTQLQQWHAAGFRDLGLAINLSPRQFRHVGLVPLIDEVLHTTGIPAAALEVELTETSLMEDVDGAWRALDALKALGVQIAVDDFGTGYSSLAYLKRFPIDTLKVDRSFVQDSTTNPHDAAIVVATIALARTLGLETVAEGVETSQHVQLLREQGCSAAQGYVLARPLTADAVTDWLHKHNPVPV